MVAKEWLFASAEPPPPLPGNCGASSYRPPRNQVAPTVLPRPDPPAPADCRIRPPGQGHGPAGRKFCMRSGSVSRSPWRAPPDSASGLQNLQRGVSGRVASPLVGLKLCVLDCCSSFLGQGRPPPRVIIDPQGKNCSVSASAPVASGSSPRRLRQHNFWTSVIVAFVVLMAVIAGPGRPPRG